MKSKIYNALASLNSGFDAALESLKALQEQGIVAAEYVELQSEVIEEKRADINCLILNKLQSKETEDLEYYSKVRVTTEARLKES